MVVEIRAQETLRTALAASASGVLSVDVEEGSQVGSVLEAVGMDLRLIGRIVINDREASRDAVLADGDKLKIWPAAAITV